MPLRQARTSMSPAYLDCCSSNRSLSMLFARSPVLHTGTPPRFSILKENSTRPLHQVGTRTPAADECMAGLASGISASAELLAAFAAARDGNVRLVKVQIEDSAMVVKATEDIKGDEKSDFAAVGAALDEDVPCYILFRMDSATKEGWLLANWVPENTKVRQKMLYASSRETLKKELGSAVITAEIIASVPRPARSCALRARPGLGTRCASACCPRRLRGAHRSRRVDCLRARGRGWRFASDPASGVQERDEITYEAYQSAVVVNEVSPPCESAAPTPCSCAGTGAWK